MYVKNIKLNNFRNYKNQEIKLEKNTNVFFGDNAQGKTNIIESIFICALGKSFRTSKEKEFIKFNEKNAKIEIEYSKKDREGKIEYIIGEKKEIFINGVKLKKMSEILGNINIVLFSPEDINILKEGPAKRRKFINMLISQLRPNYVYTYNMYFKVLEQRNNYLKNININNYDENLLNIYDEKLAEYGIIINNYRNEFIEKIKLKINKIHKTITEEKEEIKIKYLSDCFDKEKFIDKLKENRNQDILRGHTTNGIQKDDILFYINGKQVSIYGSQGQQRTTILSLKMCELEIIKDEIDEYPILLLDDFMSELDEKRKNNFLNNMEEMQIIITCTDDININKINKYKVKSGEVLLLNT